MNAEELRSRVHESAGYERLLAPNEYAAIGFDDFVLFTRVTKQIGLRLCRVARPTDQEIAEMLSATEDHRRSLNRLVRRFRGEPESELVFPVFPTTSMVAVGLPYAGKYGQDRLDRG